MARSAVSTGWSIRQFVSRLSSTDPAPGGGAAAALSGALGAALVAMVIRVLLARPRVAPSVRRRMREELRAVERISRRLQELIREDAVVYQKLVRAQRRGTGIAAARRRAIRTPLEMCEAVCDVLKTLKGILPAAGPYLGSDLKAARAILKGSFEAASGMAFINVRCDRVGPKDKLFQGQLVSLQKKVKFL
ncbi:MAG: cyclodeaminase/cyclohydrolase family protein [Candidatus Omnitrophica bacterium]|nr:cyclodeaminase/cyclohydrolase family protein [Candidatus Omnitrophota bacterium]